MSYKKIGRAAKASESVNQWASSSKAYMLYVYFKKGTGDIVDWIVSPIAKRKFGSPRKAK